MIEIVNGYPCRNCTGVENAKKNIDPAHPKAAPEPQGRGDEAAFVLGGSLAGLGPVQPPANAEPPRLDVRV